MAVVNRIGLSTRLGPALEDKPRVAIVGGGIGGVTAAIFLQRAGFPVKVYDQAPAFARVGAGINLAPNGMRVLESLGLGDALAAVGVRPRTKLSREWQSGEILFTVPVDDLVALYGAPFMAFHRGDLQEVLVGALDPDTLVFGKRLVGLETRGEANTLAFADGTNAEADIVIGADGVHSKVREALFGAAAPHYHGLIAYRAIFPTARLGGTDIVDNTKWWAPDRYFLNYFMSERRDELYFVTGVPAVWEHSDFSPRAASKEEVRAAFEGFHPEVQAMIEAADEISSWAMLERDPFTPWSEGNAVLLGDSCHATTPHMGQGAGMAIEDGAMLARALDEASDVATAFALYEASRFERTARIQRESHRNEWSKSSMDHKWVYGYDAVNEPLATPAGRDSAPLSLRP
ncbi:FAD-dependent monooxygenase [Acuticoccus kandeliae]|uniref:FAD-dependent monooxygenase n=1 Tax=Acuticoccus kandeliae TaxID=2073160 RepID=UPI00196A4C2A|nr:FAD-dependent monooxygenase [Acuticoccus kandeliae]